MSNFSLANRAALDLAQVNLDPQIIARGGESARHPKPNDAIRARHLYFGARGESRIVAEKLYHGGIGAARHLGPRRERCKEYNRQTQAECAAENQFFHFRLPLNDTVSGGIRQKIYAPKICRPQSR
jgi:hypothetical protein